MPIVQYGDPQERTALSQGARAQALPASSFPGAQLAQGVADVGTGLLAYQEDVSKTKAEEAVVNFEREKNKLFFDPDGGYFNLQGKNAYDTAPDIMDKLNTLKRTYSDSLDTEQAREMFEGVATRQLLSSQTDVMQHASKGYQAWEIATSKAVVENTIENASLYWNDPKKLAVQRELGRQTVIDVAEREGITGDALNERLQTFDSSFALSSVNSALTRSSADAEEALARYGDQLEPPVRNKVDASIAQLKKSEKTQRDSQLAVMQANGLIDTYGNDRGSVIEALREIDDPELQKQTRREAMYQLNQLDKADTRKKLDAYDAAYDFTTTQGSAEAFKAAYPDQWDMLTPSQKKSITSGEGQLHDWVQWYEVSSWSDQELAGLTPKEVADVTTRFDKSHRDKFVTMWRSALNESTATEKTDHQVGRTRASQTKNSIEILLGKKSSKWNDEDKRKVDNYYSLIDNEVNMREQTLGRRMESGEYTKLLNNLTREIAVERSFLGVSYTSDRMAANIKREDIPEDDATALTNYLQRNNIPVTDDNLVRAYRQAAQ